MNNNQMVEQLELVKLIYEIDYLNLKINDDNLLKEKITKSLNKFNPTVSLKADLEIVEVINKLIGLIANNDRLLNMGVSKELLHKAHFLFAEENNSKHFIDYLNKEKVFSVYSENKKEVINDFLDILIEFKMENMFLSKVLENKNFPNLPFFSIAERIKPVESKKNLQIYLDNYLNTYSEKELNLIKWNIKEVIKGINDNTLNLNINERTKLSKLTGWFNVVKSHPTALEEDRKELNKYLINNSYFEKLENTRIAMLLPILLKINPDYTLNRFSFKMDLLTNALENHVLSSNLIENSTIDIMIEKPEFLHALTSIKAKDKKYYIESLNKLLNKEGLLIGNMIYNNARYNNELNQYSFLTLFNEFEDQEMKDKVLNEIIKVFNKNIQDNALNIMYYFKLTQTYPEINTLNSKVLNGFTLKYFYENKDFYRFSTIEDKLFSKPMISWVFSKEKLTEISKTKFKKESLLNCLLKPNHVNNIIEVLLEKDDDFLVFLYNNNKGFLNKIKENDSKFKMNQIEERIMKKQLTENIKPVKFKPIKI